MDCRLDALDFDIAASAGWYSAIAGLLAGFALLSILIPLDHESEDAEGGRAADAVVILTCAFFGLLILGFSYAVLSGRTREGAVGIAAHEQLLLGAALGLSSVLLLFALHAVLASYGASRRVFRPAQRVIISATSLLAPLVVLAFQFSSALDLERFRLDLDADGKCGFGGLPSGVWVNLAITGAGAGAVLALAVLRHRIPRDSRIAALTGRAVLGFTVLVAIWTSVGVPLLPADVVTGAVFEHLTLAVTAGATVAVAAASWAGR